MSTSSQSHSKQRGLPDLAAFSSDQITTSVPRTFMNEGPRCAPHADPESLRVGNMSKAMTAEGNLYMETHLFWRGNS